MRFDLGARGLNESKKGFLYGVLSALVIMAKGEGVAEEGGLPFCKGTTNPIGVLGVGVMVHEN